MIIVIQLMDLDYAALGHASLTLASPMLGSNTSTFLSQLACQDLAKGRGQDSLSLMTDFLSRARTPTSPSPSPEPPAGPVGSGPSGAQDERSTAGGVAANTVDASTSLSFAAGQHASTLPEQSTDHLVSSGSGVNESISSQDQNSEMARQVLEEKIRIGVDDLMQLAMCAGDVQPGDEDIVRMKM
jgi:hypothetical protein